ncbi:hypothetical protein J6590_101981 [Homalodisca vitripennis]|nr:hypothetical protein J6590_101981 [Homalodisca vitripennis]
MSKRNVDPRPVLVLRPWPEILPRFDNAHSAIYGQPPLLAALPVDRSTILTTLVLPQMSTVSGSLGDLHDARWPLVKVKSLFWRKKNNIPRDSTHIHA